MAGDSAAKVVALASADDSIFASSNALFQQSVVEGLQIAHAVAKENLTVPMLLRVTDTETVHLAEPWVRRDDLSDEPPAYILTQGSASPESKLQQLSALVQMRGADGQPLMTTAQFHEANPDPSLRPQTSEVERVRRTRPLIIAQAILVAAEQVEAEGELPPEWVEVAAQQLHMQLGQEFPLEQGDDPQQHIDSLDEIILDETIGKLSRAVARMRREMYAEWQAQLAAYQMQMQGGMGAMMGGAPQGQPQTQGSVGSGSHFAGSPSSDEMASATGGVPGLTRMAQQGQV
jgi:hypothetical protein